MIHFLNVCCTHKDITLIMYACVCVNYINFFKYLYVFVIHKNIIYCIFTCKYNICQIIQRDILIFIVYYVSVLLCNFIVMKFIVNKMKDAFNTLVLSDYTNFCHLSNHFHIFASKSSVWPSLATLLYMFVLGHTKL